jgi:hypothetical protein
MTNATLSAEERQLRLNEASAQFMNNEITSEEFARAKEQYVPDYRSAILALADVLDEPNQEQTKAQNESGAREVVAFLFALIVLVLILIGIRRDIDDSPPTRAAA